MYVCINIIIYMYNGISRASNRSAILMSMFANVPYKCIAILVIITNAAIEVLQTVVLTLVRFGNDYSTNNIFMSVKNEVSSYS